MDDQPRRPETTAEKASPENAKAIAAKILAEHEAKTAAHPLSPSSGVARTAADLKQGMTVTVTMGTDATRASRIEAADAPAPGKKK